MNTDFFDIVTNPEKIRKELIYYSLFLMVFENFVSHWMEETRSFYANSYSWDENKNKLICGFVKPLTKDGELRFVPDKDAEKKYLNEVLHLEKNHDGKWNPKLSLFRWMVNFGLIEDNDFVTLSKCYEKRNIYGHEIASCLNKEVPVEDKQLLKDLIDIGKSASRKWILMVEIPTNPDLENESFFDENGNYKEPDVISGFDMFYSLVLFNLKDIFDGETEDADRQCGG